MLSLMWLSPLLLILPLVQGITWRGADISSLINLEGSGRTYRDTSGGAVTPFERILHNHGANIARIRIWTSTSSSQYSLNYGLSLAKRAAAAGMTLLVDLHYSDTWADPGHQAIPSAWPTTLAGLNTQIFTYTRDVVNAFTSQGTPIQFIQIGNEINDGLLWPVGRISTNGFSPASQLLHSAANGVRAASGGSSVKVMVHISNGWDSSGVNFFWNGIFLPGQFATTDFDLFGFSFYPFYGTGATLSALQSTMTGIVNKFNKDVMIVETDWPATGSCSGTTLSERSIPISVAGQVTWVNDIKNVMSALPNGHGIGVVYWEPGWIGNGGLGSSCSDNLLVDGSGVSRSSMSMFSS